MSAIDDYEASFDHWEWQARQALGRRGIGYHQATPLIEEAREHHAVSGDEDARQALGTPEQFAADVAATNPELLAGRDAHGQTPWDYVTDGLFLVACQGILVALVGAWANRGLTIPLTVAGLTGTVLVAAAALAFASVPGALRAAGHPRLAPWGFAAAGVLVLAAASAFAYLPKTRMGELPVLVLLAVSLFACWYLTHPGPAPAAVATGRSPGSGPADSGLTDSGPADSGLADSDLADSSPAVSDPAGSGLAAGGGRGRGANGDPIDPGAWFTRLRAVLVGRFDVPAERAAELVAEARAHVAETGALPSEEFPSLDEYARELADAEPVRRGPWWRGPAAALLATVFVIGWGLYVVVEAVVERNWGVMILGLLAAPLAVSMARTRFRAWSTTRPPRPAGT
ncbi:hypothetical protein [Actinoplanes aureus]|uniref:Uncharacterized protein n=1 Tax=Actinoplanes aureus TaxID=2792083 RepID=A0A931CHZ6_9ACTN|nr:hypothetical protein [Actinoplanes aureus]MBG0567967.1 hypothetical protein [Actinoplanes aureus]